MSRSWVGTGTGWAHSGGKFGSSVGVACAAAR